MTINTERLKTDAAYWDEVAPVGARYYIPETGIFVEQTIGRPGSTAIPRPTKPAAPEWDVESVKYAGMKFQSSLGECELMAIDSNKVTCCVRLLDDGHLQFCSLDALAPIPTKEQRQREELEKAVENALKRVHCTESDKCAARRVADAILSDGWRKE